MSVNVIEEPPSLGLDRSKTKIQIQSDNENIDDGKTNKSMGGKLNDVKQTLQKI